MAQAALADWIGRQESAVETVHKTPVHALLATFDRLAPPEGAGLGGPEQGSAGLGETLPLLWHWLYFLPLAPQGQIGPDGHPRRGGFLPPVPLERRMWAGGRLRFFEPILIGDRIEKHSEILSVKEKEGKAGAMVFVTVRHRIETPRGLAVEEEQDIVYLAMPEAFRLPPPLPLPEEAQWTDEVPLDPVLLFRFSALTFNGHRIHYDLPYAKDTEKYPGLVVHGPLQAMLLMAAGLRRHRQEKITGFSFRGVRPVFDFDQLRLVGLTAEAGAAQLFSVVEADSVGMKAELTWSG